MELFLLPALFAISLKIAIFFRYSESLRKANLNLALFFIAACLLNFIELFGFEAHYEGNLMLTILLAYYCAIVLTVHGYLNVALHYSEFSWKLPQIKLVLNVLLAVLIINIIFNRQLIAGAEFTNTTVTRITGPLYWVFQTYAVGGVCAGLLILFKGFRTLPANLSRQRCFVILLSSLPPAMVTLAVLAAMAAGAEITAALIMPIAISLMVGIIVYAEETTRLFQLLTLVPYSAERKLHKQLLNKITDCLLISDDPAVQPELNLKQMMKEFEVSVVEHVIRYYHGNQKLAAKALGVSEATISRRARAMNCKNPLPLPAKTQVPSSADSIAKTANATSS
jgi:hypothetical protein